MDKIWIKCVNPIHFPLNICPYNDQLFGILSLVFLFIFTNYYIFPLCLDLMKSQTQSLVFYCSPEEARSITITSLKLFLALDFFIFSIWYFEMKL